MRENRFSTQRSRARWQIGLASLGACLLTVLLMTGIAVAATDDPNWAGTPPANVSNSPLNRAWRPNIEIDSSGEMVVTWSDERTSGHRDIYYISDSGAGWSTPQAVSQTAPESKYPALTPVGDRHFVAWIEPGANKVYEAEIGVDGVRSIASLQAVVDAQLDMVASTDRLHIVFGADDQGVPDLFYASRSLAGTVWPTAKRIYTSTAFYGSSWPVMTVGASENTLHLVWQDKGKTVDTVMYMSGTVSGPNVTWSPAIALSTAITEAVRPDIAVDAHGNVHVVWAEIAEGREEEYVNYRRYDIGDGSWTTPMRIDPTLVQVNRDNPTYIEPTLALWEQGGEVEVCVAWYGFRTGDPIVEEVLLRCSGDGGDSWTAGTRNVSRSSTVDEWEVSMRPAMTFDILGQLHVVWQERAGAITNDYEIYYAASLPETVYLPLVLRNY